MRKKGQMAGRKRGGFNAKAVLPGRGKTRRRNGPEIIAGGTALIGPEAKTGSFNRE